MKDYRVDYDLLECFMPVGSTKGRSLRLCGSAVVDTHDLDPYKRCDRWLLRGDGKTFYHIDGPDGDKPFHHIGVGDICGWKRKSEAGILGNEITSVWCDVHQRMGDGLG